MIWIMAILKISKLTCPRTSLPNCLQETSKIARLIRATKPFVNKVDIMFFSKNQKK
jgi:hypothetical protein